METVTIDRPYSNTKPKGTVQAGSLKAQNSCKMQQEIDSFKTVAACGQHCKKKAGKGLSMFKFTFDDVAAHDHWRIPQYKSQDSCIFVMYQFLLVSNMF